MLSTLIQSKACVRVGLDPGAFSMRAVELTKSGSTHVVSRKLHVQKMNPAVEGAVETDENAVTGLVVGIRQAGFHGRTVLASLNAPDVDCFMLELPQTASADRADMVQLELERLMAKDAAVETDHWVLPATEVTSPDVIGVAACHDTVMRFLASCHDGGMRCTRIDAAPCALTRFGCALNAWRDEELWGILDLGFRQTRLTLCLEATPILVRAAGCGGDAWTQLIAESLSVSPKTAEIHKRESGIAAISTGESSEFSLPGRAELPSMLLGILRSSLNELATEIKRSYDYTLSCYPGRTAAGLVLVGGGASLPNLARFLADALGIDVRPASAYLGNDSCRLTYPSSTQDRVEGFAQAIGAALNG